MSKATAQKKSAPAILDTKGGQFAFIRGHVSSKSAKLTERGLLSFTVKKDYKFQVSTGAAALQIDLDEQALNAVTSLDVAAILIAKHCGGLPITLISAAMQELQRRIEARREGGDVKRGPKVTATVATDSKGRTLIRAVLDQRSGKWTLEICNAAQLASYSPEITAEQQDELNKHYQSEAYRLLQRAYEKCKLSPEPLEVKNACALINKVIPAKSAGIRRFTLIGRSGEATCDSISIGGQVFTDMLSVVAAFRPDLLPLFEK